MMEDKEALRARGAVGEGVLSNPNRQTLPRANPILSDRHTPIVTHFTFTVWTLADTRIPSDTEEGNKEGHEETEVLLPTAAVVCLSCPASIPC